MERVEVPRSDFATKDVATVPSHTTIEGIRAARVDALNLFIGSLVHAYQVSVVYTKAHSEPNKEYAMHGNDCCNRFLLHCFEELGKASGLTYLRCNNSELKEARCQDEHIQDTCGCDEAVEQPIVALAYAIANPGAMVIKPLHTILAQGTMRAPWWSVNVASGAVLQLEGVPTQHQIVVPLGGFAPVRLGPDVKVVIVVLLSRHDARIA
mmetsp:Transcript_57643/g.106558  ORF Transcript_57643/g.106558 Transcript_57643/m.106558 type:complete len:209 (+) Transcript_57643:293-919(+)